MTSDISVPDSAVEAAVDGIRERLKWASMHWGTEDVHPDAWPHIARAALTAAAPHIAAQERTTAGAMTELFKAEHEKNRDLRAERDSILRRINRLESDESWWVGGAWGDYGEAVIPLRALSTLTGPLADAGPEWETEPGFAATWGDLRATVERQEAEFTDLRARIEALRDEWQMHEAANLRAASTQPENSSGLLLHTAIAGLCKTIADALDALLREGE